MSLNKLCLAQGHLKDNGYHDFIVRKLQIIVIDGAINYCVVEFKSYNAGTLLT